MDYARRILYHIGLDCQSRLPGRLSPMKPTSRRSKVNDSPNSLSCDLKWYRRMCLIRAFDREVLALNKAGLVPGTAHLYIGMEAIAVGACSAMKGDDYLTSPHRGHGHAIARGLDPARMMA